MRLFMLVSLLVQLVNCKLDLNAYNFGKNGGSIIYNYDENNLPDTKLDSIELSFITYTFNCTLLHISSAISTDHITIRLIDGVPSASYNLGFRTHQISFKRPIRINDGNYHKLRFNRFGQNSTLQLDSNWTINLHPKSRSNVRPFTVFNAHSHIRLGGIDNQQYLNYELDSYSNDNIETNKDEYDGDEDNLEENALLNKDRSRLNKRTNFILSNQIVNYDHFVGIMLNVYVNGYSILDMASNDNPNVIVSGDVHLLLSLPKSSIHKLNHKLIHNAHHNKTSSHHKASFKHPFKQLNNQLNDLDSRESAYLKHKSQHAKTEGRPIIEPKDPFSLMQGDQPSYENHQRKSSKNKVVKVNKNENKNENQQQNYEGDDLIFSGSGCFDDEDECANYADAGSGYDDLITPVYVSIKPTPITQPKTKSKSNKQNSSKRGSKCTPMQEQEQANRQSRTEDDDNEEDDDDDDDCGSGDDSPSGSNSEETTERSNSIDNDHLYQLSTELSNVINPVTIDEDRTMTDLFTSQPIPPPASEIEKIIESTTRRPLPPKKQGNIEIIMLPLPPSETATQKTNFNLNKNLNRDNKNKHLSGIQITDGGLSPNDINNLEDDLDSNFDSNLNQYGGSNRENGMSESSNEILGAIPISIINKNLIDFKFNKNADRTALLIAAIAILIIIVIIIAPIVVFVKTRLRLSRNDKLAGVPITSAQLSPAYQVTNKSYASLAASGSMHPLGAPPLNALNPVSFASNPNFHTSMHHLAMNQQIMPPNLTITTNPVYGTIDKAPKLPNKKDLGKEWYV